MNEELQREIASLINESKDGLISFAEKLTEQMPILAEQILVYHFYQSISLFGVGLLLVLIGTPSLIFFLKRDKDEYYDGVFFAFSLFGACIGLFMLILNTTWIKILVAPKLFILEYLVSLVKG